jgi:hypothetical protein
MITDDMVKKAFNAWWDIGDDLGDVEAHQMRAALEAVAPMILAQGLQEIEMVDDAIAKAKARAGVDQQMTKPKPSPLFCAGYVAGLREAIEVIDASEGDGDYAKFKLQNRIQELDPK